MSELYLQVTIRLHDVILNELSTGTMHSTEVLSTERGQKIIVLEQACSQLKLQNK
jgi:hypothetical protein